ncbi:hypothetical protein F0310_04325 (plasmid) [Borrelia sp. A-FGy1]|uniref:hypothetical protein n=1 Tax=Borrelia sp. A-FGy1 TaxID=2608247 RepID=UPI0015F69654|nr:hypothetical protein [Borrelia sp. A-FGy1]QMU99644.1 hypothetical protein F0310_04325 [Borrelia sp. A-FGy1]
MDKIYAGLGYDADSIKKLEEVFPILTVTLFGHVDDMIPLSGLLLKLFIDINFYTQEVLSKSLQRSNLSNLKVIKNPDIFNLIAQRLDEFMSKRKNLLSKIKASLSVMHADKSNKTLIYNEIQRMTDNNLIFKRECGNLEKISKEIGRLINLNK